MGLLSKKLGTGQTSPAGLAGELRRRIGDCQRLMTMKNDDFDTARGIVWACLFVTAVYAAAVISYLVWTH
jgi:hypothetical protein